MGNDDSIHGTRARGGNAPGTEDPADAPADIGAGRGQGSATRPDTGAGRGAGSGILADPEITGQTADRDGPRVGTGDNLADADDNGRSGR